MEPPQLTSDNDGGGGSGDMDSIEAGGALSEEPERHSSLRLPKGLTSIQADRFGLHNIKPKDMPRIAGSAPQTPVHGSTSSGNKSNHNHNHNHNNNSHNNSAVRVNPFLRSSSKESSKSGSGAGGAAKKTVSSSMNSNDRNKRGQRSPSSDSDSSSLPDHLKPIDDRYTEEDLGKPLDVEDLIKRLTTVDFVGRVTEWIGYCAKRREAYEEMKAREVDPCEQSESSEIKPQEPVCLSYIVVLLCTHVLYAIYMHIYTHICDQ